MRRRLPRRRRRRPQPRRHSARHPTQRRSLRRGIAALLLCVAVFWALDRQLRPVITAMALSQVNNAAMEIIGSTIMETMAGDTVDYDRIIELETNNDGNVTAVQTNIQEINRLRSQITSSVLARVDDLTNKEIGVPLGSLTGINLLSARGPMLWIRILSVSSVHSSVQDSFISAGINQTRYRVILSVDTELAVLLPGYTANTTVHNEVNVAETVLVGSVPNSYTYFSQFDSVEDAVNYFNDYGPGRND